MSARALAPRAPASGVMVSATPRHPKMIAADAIDALMRIESELLILETATEAPSWPDMDPVAIGDTMLGILARIRAVRVSLESA